MQTQLEGKKCRKCRKKKKEKKRKIGKEKVNKGNNEEVLCVWDGVRTTVLSRGLD